MSHLRASPGSTQGHQISPGQNINMADRDEKLQTEKQRCEILLASLLQPLEVPHQSSVSLHLLYLPALLSFLYNIKSSTSLF